MSSTVATEPSLADASIRRGGRAGAAYAALDLGTNNCRLLVARPRGRGFQVIDSFSRIVRLGEGVEATGRLSEAAMNRSLAALSVCADKIGRFSIARLRAVATEACRRAANCAEFLDRVEAHTGLRVETISSREEGLLALEGCRPLLDLKRRRALLFDIGGGSTELMWLALEPGGGCQVLGWTSLPCGVVTLAERFGPAPDARGFAAMRDHVETLLAPFEARTGLRRAMAGGGAQMLGTSGTVTTLAGVHLGLERYDRARVDGMVMGFDALDAVVGQLVAMDHAQRQHHPCIGRDRADFVLAGCAILAALCALWPKGRLRVADRGLREGILMRLMAQDRPGAVCGPLPDGSQQAAL